jgi:glyoxylase-like metal-dependent hydrolase (beta-lactamase superfamily II)
MQIIPLSEGTFTIDKTKLFVPFDESVDKLNARSKGSLLVEIQPFVVKTSKDVLLLDMGLGFSVDGKMQIHQNLRDAGVEPNSITKVLLSHLHKDHAGGVSEDSDRNRLSFPNAIYYLQERELKFATEKGLPSFIPEEFEVLKNSSQVVLLDEDEGTIGDQISYQMTGAHSPFHQVFWIREGTETIFFGADDAPQLAQMKHKYAAKYDFDGKKAMQLRQDWWLKGTEENWSFLFYHDVMNPFYKAKP